MRRKLRPGIESLEGKALLSGATSGLAESLTVAKVGGREVLTFTETNVSDQPVDVTHGPSNSGFVATRAGKTVWVSNTGMQAQFLQVDTLQPHQSLTLQATWNGRSNQGGPAKALKGSFKVTNELDPSGASATVVLGPVKKVATPRPPAHKPG